MGGVWIFSGTTHKDVVSSMGMCFSIIIIKLTYNTKG